MEAAKRDLTELTDELLEEVGKRIREISVVQYRCVCNDVMRHAEKAGVAEWSPELDACYRAHIDERLEKGAMCVEYHRFQLRVLRMLESLATTGEVDFSAAPSSAPAKYPLSDEATHVVDEILGAQRRMSDRAKSDYRSSLRHLMWFAEGRGVSPLSIDDALVMDFIVGEVPRTTSGSADRTLRAVRLATDWLRANGGATLRDYSMLSLRNTGRAHIPAFTEAEVGAIVGSIDASAERGKRDRAIVLLAYCTGLRGCDVLSLRRDEVDWRNQRLTTTQSKTGEPITCELNGETINALADYVLEARPESDLPEIFLTSNLPPRPMTGSLSTWFDRICAKAGVEKVPGRSFHSLRRAFETTLVSGGVELETASQMMGHKDVKSDLPYLTYNREVSSHIAMGFGDAPIRHGSYAPKGGDAK